MSEAFSKLVQKRQSASKTKAKRDPSSGQFDPLSPLNDPALLEQAIRWVRAIDELSPVLLAFSDNLEPDVAGLAEVSFLTLGALKKSLLDALSPDQDAVRDATKPLLRAVRLRPMGNQP